MENRQSSLPTWFWIVAILAVIWNLMGLVSFLYHIFLPADALNAMSEAEQALYNSTPVWANFAFALATIAGSIGAVGLVKRKKWAKTAFIASLVGIIPQMTHYMFFTKAREVYGSGVEVMPALVVIFGILLLWFSGMAIKRNWLN